MILKENHYILEYLRVSLSKDEFLESCQEHFNCSGEVSQAQLEKYLGVPQRKLRIMCMAFNNVDVNADEGQGWGEPGPQSKQKSKKQSIFFFTKRAGNGVHGMTIGRIGAKFRCAFVCFGKDT